MLEVKLIDKCHACCQVCGNDASEDMNDRIYSVRVANKYDYGAELHLCNNCCKELGGLLTLTVTKGVKLVSIDNIDK